MDRREFLQRVSASVGSAVIYSNGNLAVPRKAIDEASKPPSESLADYTLMARFEYAGGTWSAYENLQSREGDLVFVSGNVRKRLSKTAEAVSAEGDTAYLGLSFDEIVRTLPDLLAQRILKEKGDPDEDVVKSAVPPIGLPTPSLPESMWGVIAAQAFTPGTFIGTKECWDTQPVLPDGSTQTFTSQQFCPEIAPLVAQGHFFDGLVGGWLPAIRKVFPMGDRDYWEIIGFPDTEKPGRSTVHTWHRVAHVDKGALSKVFYRQTYPTFKKLRQPPKPEEFYRALLSSLEYWEANLQEFTPVALPRQDWADMAKHAFVKELIARPDGVHPRYGALDRIYGGSEHDGFQDTFTNAVYANLEWGRFSAARSFIENYFDDYVDERGAIDYRGPEIGQFGLMLAVMAKYYRYTGDQSILLKYQAKLQAISDFLTGLHVDSLDLPANDSGHGLIHGWSEADTNGTPDPDRYWQPYFGNSALVARGFRDLGGVWSEIAHKTGKPGLDQSGKELVTRSKQLQVALISSIERSARRDMDPPYVGALPGMEHTFVDAGRLDPLGPQMYSSRSYLELLQADMLPAALANLVIDCLRAYGGTTLGIPRESRECSDPNAKERSVLGFLSYGYAQMLLRLGRTEEFLLFLYAHRYHCHQRGHWTAREAAGISRRPDTYIDPYCTPAQQAIPLLIRWMLVLEDSDEVRLYLGRGIPCAWVVSGKPISIERAPTRWGPVRLSLAADPQKKTLHAIVELAKPIEMLELHLSLRVPEGSHLRTVAVNGNPTRLGGSRKDVVLMNGADGRRFDVIAHYE